jgi:hypothetical protein
MLNSEVQVAPFIEHPIVDYSVSEPGPFDITAVASNHVASFIISDRFSLQQYCVCLLHKLTLLNKSEIKPFIQYQCELLIQPFVWLNKFEKLIDLNRDLFNTKDRLIKMEKALVIIELLRQEIQSNKFKPSNRFNFEKVKQKVKDYPTIEEKLLYLAEAKTEYLQNKSATVPPGEVPFDEKVQLEIDLLKTQSKLNKKRQQAFTDQSNKSPLSPLKKSPATKDKFRINTNLNQFVDIFYQLMHEKKINNKPYLEASPHEISEMIAAHFKDKDGRDISIDTVKTILKPSRFEKRPKGNSRFDIHD